MPTLAEWIGVELDPVSSKEKYVSAIGGCLAIGLVALIHQYTLPPGGGSMLVASMGASAVLLFGVPHGALSQPWPVLAGHAVSAAIGVICARWIPAQPLAAGCAVGISIGVMHQLKCIHPPGGATALTAVIGGPGVAALGFSYVWRPVLADAVSMVAIAVAFNGAFHWRRYPAMLGRRLQPVEAGGISHAAVVEALRGLDSFVDVTEDDLVQLVRVLSKEPLRPAGGSPVDTDLPAVDRLPARRDGGRPADLYSERRPAD